MPTTLQALVFKINAKLNDDSAKGKTKLRERMR